MDVVSPAVLHTCVTDHFGTGLVITTPHTHLTSDVKVPSTYTDEKQLSNNIVSDNSEPVSNSLEADSCAELQNGILEKLISSSKKPIKNNTRYNKLKPWISLD